MNEINQHEESYDKKNYQAPEISVLAEAEDTEAGGPGSADAGVFS